MYFSVDLGCLQFYLSVHAPIIKHLLVDSSRETDDNKARAQVRSHEGLLHGNLRKVELAEGVEDSPSNQRANGVIFSATKVLLTERKKRRRIQRKLKRQNVFLAIGRSLMEFGVLCE
jgi:hypothetical protein